MHLHIHILQTYTYTYTYEYTHTYTYTYFIYILHIHIHIHIYTYILPTYYTHVHICIYIFTQYFTYILIYLYTFILLYLYLYIFYIYNANIAYIYIHTHLGIITISGRWGGRPDTGPYNTTTRSTNTLLITFDLIISYLFLFEQLWLRKHPAVVPTDSSISKDPSLYMAWFTHLIICQDAVMLIQLMLSPADQAKTHILTNHYLLFLSKHITEFGKHHDIFQCVLLLQMMLS